MLYKSTMPHFSLFRYLFAAGACGCGLLIAIAMYFQHVLGLEPCPLCIMQRLVLIGLGVVLLQAAVHDPAQRGRKVYALLAMLLATIGAMIAGRHVWLQHLPPDQVPECGPGLEYMLSNFPMMQNLSMILAGSGECAEVQWHFLGLSIPAWTLAVFLMMCGICVAILCNKRP